MAKKRGISKKGALDMQFNWIFVLVAGAAILIFVFSFLSNQRTISESKLAVSVLTDIETITTGAEISRGTAQIITIPDLDIKFSASETCLREFIIGKNSRQLDQQYIFAPTNIIGRQIVSWTLDFSQPFRTANIVLFTSPLIRYIIVADSNNDLAKEINETLPEGMVYSWETLDGRLVSEVIASTEDLNYYKTRFIIIDDTNTVNLDGMNTPPDLEKYNGFEVTALKIIPSANYYQVEFYKENDDRFEFINSSFAVALQGSDTESVYAAIFAEDPQLYNCNMKDIFSKIKLVTGIYKDRTYALYEYENRTNPSSTCQIPYLSSTSYLETIYSEAGNLAETFPQSPNTYVDAASHLASANKRLRQQSCVEIY